MLHGFKYLVITADVYTSRHNKSKLNDLVTLSSHNLSVIFTSIFNSIFESKVGWGSCLKPGRVPHRGSQPLGPPLSLALWTCRLMSTVTAGPLQQQPPQASQLPLSESTVMCQTSHHGFRIQHYI